MRIKKRDLTGCRFGKLVVLHAVSEVKEGYGASVWRCRCDCGKEVNVMYFGLVSGNNKSCGCLKEESQKNLRERMELVDGTCVEWLKDRKIRTDNKSGCKGVYKRKSGKYSVTIGFKKRIIYLGTYDSKEEAVEVRKKAERLYTTAFWKVTASGRKGQNRIPNGRRNILSNLTWKRRAAGSLSKIILLKAVLSRSAV